MRANRRIATSTAVSVALTLLMAAAPTAATAEPTPEGQDYWRAEPAIDVRGVYEPLVGDFDGDLDDDIYWYAGSAGTESLWLGERGGPIGGAFRSVPAQQVSGDYEGLVGNFAGDRSEDILWYGAGGVADVLWVNSFHRHRPGRQQRLTIDGTYAPVVLDDAVGLDGIVWVGATREARIWTFVRDGIVSVRTVVPSGSFAVPGDYDGNGRMDVLWYGAGSAEDRITWRTYATAESTSVDIHGTYRVVSGQFQPSTTWDIWFQPLDDDPRFDRRGTAFVWYGDAPDDREFAKTEDSSFAGIPLALPRRGADADDLLLYDGVSDSVREIVWPHSRLRGTGNTPFQVSGSRYLVGHFTGRKGSDVLVYGTSGARSDQLYLARTDPY